ncbi:radical SAM protein [Spongiactinospora sp. 9N601]|uniref:radical SAM protein n=1 Tax=Spongiactinospora sp. 9N601 TaxID=3375149 RepID=UPI0037BC770F
MRKPITLLWSLRSPCNLGCRYCYFGTIEEHRGQPARPVGQLSHLSRDDLKADEVFAFARTLDRSPVGRVYVAGGEPLIWPPILDLLKILKEAGIEVVVCTNGIPLGREEILTGLVSLGIDAISVSLDSTDPAYNDRWRPARNGADGWPQVINGIRAARHATPRLRIGVYSVITRCNIPQVVQVARLAADLGCDYYVPQPVALDATHPLHKELSLRVSDIPAIREAFAELYSLPLTLPHPGFPAQVIASISHATATVQNCFGGHTLHFIQPDGTVWDCPSYLRIAATPESHWKTIKGHSATEIFPEPRGCGASCALFSRDCVNMWPLMDGVPLERAA